MSCLPPVAVCSEDQDGLVWAQMEPPAAGRCTRHVRACRGGRVVTTASLQDREHVCDATGPELCRVETFFTCCPVFDCRKFAGRLTRLCRPDQRTVTDISLSPYSVSKCLPPVSAAFDRE